MSFNTFITINLQDRVTRALRRVQRSLNRVREVNTNINVNDRALERTRQTIRRLDNQRINLSVQASNRNLINVQNSLNRLRNRSVLVNVRANSQGFEQVERRLQNLSNRSVNIRTRGDFRALRDITNRLSRLQNRTIRINTEGNLRGLNNVMNRINNLRNRALRINARVNIDGIREDRSTIQRILNNIRVRVQVDRNDFKNQVAKFAGVAVATAVPVKVAMDYETLMVDPAKVTADEWNFDKNIRPIIEKLYRETPAKLKAITALAQEGIATGKLKVDIEKGDFSEVEEFIRLASESKVAFEVADDSLKKAINSSMSKLNYSIKETRELFDMLNYATTISPAKMVDMLNVLGRTAGNLKDLKRGEIASIITFGVEKGVSPELTASSLNAIVKRTKALDYTKFETMIKRLQMSISSNPIAQILGSEHISRFQKSNGKLKIKALKKAVKAGEITQEQFKKIEEHYMRNVQSLDDVIKTIEKMGNPAKAFDEGRGFEYIYKILEIARNIKDANLRTNFLKGIYGTGEASNLAQNMLNDLPRLKMYHNKIMTDKKRLDSVKKEYDMIMSTANASMQRFKNNMAMLAIEATKPLLKPLRLFFDYLSDSLGVLVNFINKHKKLSNAILIALGAVTLFGAGLLAFKGIVLASTFIFSGLTSVISLLASPLMLIIGLVAVLITNWDRFTKGLSNTISIPLIDNLKIAFSNLWTTIQPIIQPILTFLTWIGEKLGIINNSAENTGVKFNLIGSIVQLIGGIIGQIFNGLIILITQVINILTWLSQVVGSVFGFFAEKVGWVVDKVVSLFNWLVKVFDLGSKLNTVVDGAKKIGNTIAEGASSAWDTTKEWLGFGDDDKKETNPKNTNGKITVIPTHSITKAQSEVTLKIRDEDKNKVQAIETLGNVKIK
jgi:hypothetical protein